MALSWSLTDFLIFPHCQRGMAGFTVRDVFVLRGTEKTWSDHQWRTRDPEAGEGPKTRCRHRAAPGNVENGNTEGLDERESILSSPEDSSGLFVNSSDGGLDHTPWELFSLTIAMAAGVGLTGRQYPASVQNFLSWEDMTLASSSPTFGGFRDPFYKVIANSKEL